MLVPPPPRAGSAHILVVDDVSENRRLLERILQRLGHTAAVAEDGEDALAKLAAGPFDLVLLDIEMPKLDGIAVLRRMKADPNLSDIPVVMVSGVDEVDAISQCIELGADDFLSKPFDHRIMRARIGSSLAKKRLRDWEQRYLKLLEEEEALSEQLIQNMLPDAIGQRLKHGEVSIAEHFDDVSVLFADIAGFTTRATTMPAKALVDLLNAVFSRCDELVRRHRLEKIKTIGDAYMAVGGLPEPKPDHLSAMADLALEMLGAMRQEHGIDLRIGIHCGPAVAGVIGTTKLSYDVWGATINIASRMESHGVPGRVQVSTEVRRRLVNDFRFELRGPVDMKNLGPMETYFLTGRING